MVVHPSRVRHRAALNARPQTLAIWVTQSVLIALTLSSFVLPDGVAALQNGSDVGLPTFFAAANCGSVSANWRCCYAVLCASWNSSRCDFVFVDRSGADRRNLFLEIGRETLATHYRAAFLLFAALVQHARRPGRVRGGEGEPPW